MKKNLFLLICQFLAGLTLANGQDKIVKYCDVIVYYDRPVVHPKRKVRISFGKDSTLFALKDSLAIEKWKAVDSLTTEPDVLNFMTKEGWELVNVHAVSVYTSSELFYFKRTFDRSEFREFPVSK